MRGMRSCPVLPRKAGRRCAFDRIGPVCSSDMRCADAIARVEGSFYRHDNNLPMNINHNVVQAVTAALALPISILAAVFTWQQLEIGREHNRLSVAPILQITPYLEGLGGKNGFYMTNEGLGPAVIKSFSVRSGGVAAEGFGADRWSEIIATTEANPACFGSGWPKGETTLRPGDEKPVLFLTKSAGSSACLAEMVKLAGGRAIDIEIGYESMYKEAKILRTDTRVASRAMQFWYRALVGRQGDAD